MKRKFELALTTALVICALATTGLLLRRELAGNGKNPSPFDEKPVLLKDWHHETANAGIRMGSSDGLVHLVEFADFECPFCGIFHKTLTNIEEKYPGKIDLTYIHFPIPGHRFAIPAARVAECAGDQGRFEAMYNQLFEGQEQFGLRPWSEYATAVGVPDMAAFDACIKKTQPIQRVEEGKASGAKLDVKATPTIIINGWKLGHPPTQDELDQMVQRVLAGKSPVDGKS